jgi:hypothetical protein
VRIIDKFVWAVADTETEFDKQLRVRCEQLGGIVQKNVEDVRREEARPRVI